MVTLSSKKLVAYAVIIEQGRSQMVSEEGLLVRMRRFDDLFLETIKDVLKRVLGEAPTKILLQRMKKVGSLKPESVEVFEDALQRILGQGASLIIEDLILRSLYSKLGLRFERIQGCTFSDYVEELRRKCGQAADS